MTDEQINRARAIVSQAKEFERNLDNYYTSEDLNKLSSDDIDRLLSGQKIEDESVTESNILRR